MDVRVTIEEQRNEKMKRGKIMKMWKFFDLQGE